MFNFFKSYLLKYKSLRAFPRFIIRVIFVCLLVSFLILSWATVEVIKNPDKYTNTNLSEAVSSYHEESLGTFNNENLTVVESLSLIDDDLEKASINITADNTNSYHNKEPYSSLSSVDKIDLSDIPSFSTKPYVAINNNYPYFDSSDLKTESFEYYSPLDNMGRCGVVYACIGTELMPTEERGEIGQIKPTGWHTIKYDAVDGKYLYNRCHLIGWQLTGENSNECNLITGTRYMNVEGMLPFENMVADYIKETKNHVLYRVTPVFEKDNLLANGVQIEAFSVEDSGEGICFNVFCYNVQPGISIDYHSGDSILINDVSENTIPKSIEKASETAPPKSFSNSSAEKSDYVVNTNTSKFHYPSCSSVGDMKEENKMEISGTRDELISDGYVPCKRCNP